MHLGHRALVSDRAALVVPGVAYLLAERPVEVLVADGQLGVLRQVGVGGVRQRVALSVREDDSAVALQDGLEGGRAAADLRIPAAAAAVVRAVLQPVRDSIPLDDEPLLVATREQPRDEPLRVGAVRV